MTAQEGEPDQVGPAGFGEAGYRLLFDHNPLPMWVFDVETLGFLAVNRATVACYGWSEAEFLGMTLQDIRPEREHARLSAHLAAPLPPLAQGSHWQHRRRNGEELEVELSSEALQFAGRAARLVVARDVTARRVAEQALLRSEQRYRDIVETANEGIWTIDADARTTFVNPKMAQMLGYSPEEMLGRPLTAFMDEQGRRSAEANLERRRQGVTEQHDFRFKRKDGSDVWAWMATNPVLDEAGRYAGALAMVTDITERRVAEQHLKLLSTSVARFNDIVIITEAEPQAEPGPRILFVNDAFERRTGYRRDEVLGRSPRFLQGPGTDRRELDRIQGALARWEPVKSELLNYTKSHEPFWLSLDIVPIADDQGWYTHWVAVEHDITARKLAELRDASRDLVMTQIASGAPLSTVLEAVVRDVETRHAGALCSLLLLDSGGSRLLNGAAPSLPAFFNQALNGMAIGPMQGTCGAAAHSGRRMVAPDMRTDERCAAFLDLADRAGLAAVWSEPVVSRSGAVLGALGVYHRQPHVPQADELASVADAARVAAIAIERHLADNALRESQKMEALGTLAGGIAHDFNNILGAILGNIELTRHEGPVPSATASRLAQIEQSAQRARQLVRQILAFSRRQPHQAVRQRLRPLVEEALSWQRVSLPAHVQLRAQLGDGLLSAEVDGTQVQQVVMNLCSNAWHALAGQPGSVEIGLEALPAGLLGGRRPAGLPPGPLAHLWVRDTGQGMDAATRSRIFDPFFTTKPVGSGTGLGLAVVHGIVSEHQGLITVDSAPGSGSTFHVYFPGARAEGPALATSEAPVLQAEPEPAPGPGPQRSGHILFVDDDAVMLLTGEGLLRSLGYRVTTADNGMDALAEVQRTPDAFDGVVADYNMPGCSGLDLARELVAAHPALPVVICSGYIDAELRSRAESVGVRALVHKEEAVEQLGPTLEQVLGPRGG